MKLELLPHDFAVCRLPDRTATDLNKEFTFFAKTDKEISYVCPLKDTPKNALTIEKGWRGMRVSGVLEFSMIGILAKIAAILAAKEISIFVVSTYDTDYIFIKEDKLEAAITALKENGYEI